MGRSWSASPDPVNQPMIRHWAAAFEDDNPVYTDAAFSGGQSVRGCRGAAAHASDVDHGDTRRSPVWPSAVVPRPRSPSSRVPLGVLDEAGFTATLAANSEFEIERYVGLGEVLTATSAVIETISEEKQTRIGRGHFVTWVTTYLRRRATRWSAGTGSAS